MGAAYRRRLFVRLEEPLVVVDLNHRTVTRALAAIIAILVAAQLAGRISTIYLGRDTVHGLVPLLNLDEERNLPTFYSALAILLSAALLAIITAAGRRSGAPDVLFWGFLTVMFLVMTFDELSSACPTTCTSPEPSPWRRTSSPSWPSAFDSCGACRPRSAARSCSPELSS